MQREKYIDVAKGIGILMVIFCHVIEACEITSLMHIFRFCYSFHMPLFFFITGYCSGMKKDTGEKPNLKADFKKISASLILPYFVWSFIYLFIGGNLFTKERLYAVFTTRGIAPIWFLATLFCCQGFLILLKALTHKMKSKSSNIIFAVIALLCLGAGYIMHLTQSRYNLSTHTMGTALYYLFVATGRFFISAPVLLGGYLLGKSKVLSKLRKLPCLLVGGALLTAVYLGVDFFSLSTNIHLFKSNNLPVLIFTSFAGAVGIIMISYSLPTFKKSILALIGTNSLYFMLLHYMPFKTISLASDIFDFIQNPTLFWICTSLGVLIITAAATFVMKRGFFLTRNKTKIK